jgi:2-polyprenyl-6-methoxyphenol hydroxylase-like FAD-dependent oxidoreductase
LLLLEQSKNELMLYEYLGARQRNVFWSTELEDFSQSDTSVTARVKNLAGEEQAIMAKYLVGCDGASSKVRHDLGLTFAGSTFERLFYVADARIDWDLPHDAVQVCLGRDVFTAFFPMPGAERYRIVGTFPESVNDEQGEILYEEIEQQIKTEVQLQLEISDVKWFSLYKVHSRRVNKFSQGRCFVVGDAAHIHSPAGAQGMNTGIQDAYNLAWKLSFVIKGYAAPQILETYNEERLPNAKRLLETTDRLFELAAGSNWLLSTIRMTVFPRVAGWVLNFDPFRKRIFPLVSQTAISYRRSSLSDHAGDHNFKVKAGDRLPYFLVNGQNIYDRLRAPKFHLLVFTEKSGAGETSAHQFRSEYGQVADLHAVPRGREVNEAFGARRDFIVLLRPDNYVAFISANVSPDGVRAYTSRLTATRR